jgi:ABC-2 type transport system permease protein
VSAATLKARKYLVAAGTSARSRSAYRGELAGSVVTYCLFLFVFSRIWRSAYASRPVIAGYDLAMSIWYFVVAEIPYFGTMGRFRDLAGDIKSGQVAYLVSRPYSFVGYRFAEAAGSSLAASLPIALAGLTFGSVLAGLPPLGSALQAACLLASLALAMALQSVLQIAIAMTAFWVEENSAFFWIFQKLGLVAGTLLPLEFLPERASRIARWTPFPALSYAPARIMVAFSPSEAGGLLAFQAAWLAASWAACLALYARGRRALSSQGG